MPRLDGWLILGLVLADVASGLLVAEALAEPAPGIVVSKSGADERLAAGTRLVGWELVDAEGATTESGDLASVIDFELARITVLPRGRMVLRGFVDDEEVRYQVPLTGFDGKVRPMLPDDEAILYDEALARWDDDAAASGEELLALAERLAKRGNDVDAAWLSLEVMRRTRDEETIERTYTLARGWLTRPTRKAYAARLRGRLERDAQQWAAARQYLEEALALDKESGASELLQAVDLSALAVTAGRSGDAAGELVHADKVLEIRRRLAPRSLALWAAYFDHFVANYHLGHLDECQQALDAALRLAEDLKPDSLEVATSLSGLGSLNWKRGDLRRAQDYFERAMPVMESLTPESLRLTGLWNDLGLVAHDRGDLIRAESYFRRAYDVLQRKHPESIWFGNILNNLGMVANERGLYDEAEVFYGRALAIYEALRPGTISVARTLNNRANNARRAGRLEAAVVDLRRSQKITSREGPETRPHATGMEVLALVLEQQGDLEGAQKFLGEAIEELERFAPGGLRVARPSHFLGRILRKSGKLREALKLQEQALKVVEKVAPGSALEAQVLNELGRLHHELEHPEAAARDFCRAVDALDAQKLRLGGNRKSGNPFDREMAHFHRDCIEALLAFDRVSEAFAVHERSRARELLVLLAQRDLVLDEAIPEELSQRRRKLNRDYDSAFGDLLGGDLSDVERTAIEERLHALRRSRDQLDRELRAADPRLAALESPQPLDAKSASRAVDPGTLFLAYSLGEDSGHVFLLPGARSVRVYPIAASRREIDDLVATFRRQIAGRDPRAMKTSHQLWRMLVAPVAAEFDSHERLLISPEGSLHHLPFAALVDADGRFLIESLPIHTVASATLYAELRRPSDSSLSRKVIAFADPQLPAGFEHLLGDERRLAGGESSSATAAALPGTRREAAVIAALFPERSHTFLGSAASESELKKVASQASLLHLATHGYLDPRIPLDSGLVLTPSANDAGDNGLLQAWEVFEQLSINADLVTLSACETGLGHELPGEGLIGLTRAFQYAGARSILASLWKVADASTARMMEHFYREVERGSPKDEALRAAQLALLHGAATGEDSRERGIGGLVATKAKGKSADPFVWAAFQLIGDRR